MDIDKYIAGKAKGASSIVLHGESTLLVSYPGGFDPDTGNANPLKQQGYQPTDITAMRESALDAVQKAQDALTLAQQKVARFDELLADIAKVKP